MNRHLYPRLVALLLASILIVLSACGSNTSAAEENDAAEVDSSNEQASDDTIDEPASAPLASAADAPAAAGSGLTERPGPAERNLMTGFGEVAIAVVAADGTVTGWCALLAETAEQRSQGLMEVTDLGGYAGMLFVSDTQRDQKFWMANTPMPLSIAWFDNEGTFVSATDMEPYDEDCEQCRSDGPARFALEVPQGELPGMDIEEGSSLKIGGSCA